MRKFYFYITPYREETAGQVEEIRRLAEDIGMGFLSRSELPKFDVLSVKGGKADVPDGILLCSKGENPDIITSVRAALSLGADGIILEVGSNPTRDYILNGEAYYFKEAQSAFGEIKRLCPLFGREF